MRNFVRAIMLPIVCASPLLTGCVSSSNVYERSPGIYTVSATGDGYTTADRVLDSAMKPAQDACRQKGLRLDVVHQDQRDTRMGFDTTITVIFRCI